jgi:low molecular weight protein-tyrosine phosphatase
LGTDKPLKVLMVCMGNICRSPTAEAVLRHKLREHGLERLVEVDSAGTHGWHEGCEPDERSQAHALRRGYDLSSIRARLLREADFDRFDLVLVMDDDNFEAASALCEPQRLGRIERLAAYARRHRASEVPDPWSGGPEGFEHVLDLIEDACDGLIAAIRQRLRGARNFGG